MKKAKDQKHLRQRHNIWWLHYNLPKRLRDHPKFENHPSIRIESLGTDSLSKAKRLRDDIIYKLNQGIDDTYEAWEQVVLNRSKEFNRTHPHLNGLETYESLHIEAIVDKSVKQFGVDPDTGHPLKVADNDAFMLDVLTKSRPDKTKMLRFLTNKVITEREADNQAPKTIFKIRRATDWFLEHTIQNDIDISLIDYDMVNAYIVQDKNKGVAGSTLNGHVYGLRQVWDRAKKSKIVTGDNPFSAHGIPKESVSYSPFSSEEVLALYGAANDELKLLIHAAVTTGARMGELLTGEVKMPTTFNKPCWFFKFKDKGKTEQSTRVVPLHSSLALPGGFTFRLTDRTVTRQFKELRDRIITNNIDECTGKPRKLSFHSFRTTLITELVVRQGISEKVVGAITGHLAGSKNIGSITSYINSDDLELKSQTVERIKWEGSPLHKVRSFIRFKRRDPVIYL